MADPRIDLRLTYVNGVAAGALAAASATISQMAMVTRPAPVTLASDFDRLVDVLAEARELPLSECHRRLWEVGAETPMDYSLKVWWLLQARQVMIDAAERQDLSRRRE